MMMLKTAEMVHTVAAPLGKMDYLSSGPSSLNWQTRQKRIRPASYRSPQARESNEEWMSAEEIRPLPVAVDSGAAQLDQTMSTAPGYTPLTLGLFHFAWVLFVLSFITLAVGSVLAWPLVTACSPIVLTVSVVALWLSIRRANHEQSS